MYYDWAIKFASCALHLCNVNILRHCIKVKIATFTAALVSRLGCIRLWGKNGTKQPNIILPRYRSERNALSSVVNQTSALPTYLATTTFSSKFIKYYGEKVNLVYLYWYFANGLKLIRLSGNPDHRCRTEHSYWKISNKIYWMRHFKVSLVSFSTTSLFFQNVFYVPVLVPVPVPVPSTTYRSYPEMNGKYG